MNRKTLIISPPTLALTSLFGLLLLPACGADLDSPDTQESIGSISAASILNYPTKWTVTNDSAGALTFSCVCPKPLGLINPINMATTTVASRSTQVVNWGRGWYNDGLGLNFCNWNCTAKRGTSVAATLSFKTDWGENITLRAKSTGGLVVQR